MKLRNAPKFAGVVRCQGVTTRQGDPCNEHIVGAYPFPRPSRSALMTPEAFARVLVQLYQLKSSAKLPAYNNAFLRFPATQRAQHQLGNRHSREKDRIPISGSQLLSHMNPLRPRSNSIAMSVSSR